jgi:hypothetical protein
MYKAALFVLLPLLISITSCRSTHRTEIEDTAFWHASFIDSSYKLLYDLKDTSRALSYFDSRIRQAESVTVYPKATRFVLLANFHYFFTSDNAATSKMIDSALALYNTSGLQVQYPRTYVSLLLFGGQIAYRLYQYNKANEYFFRAKKG